MVPHFQTLLTQSRLYLFIVQVYRLFNPIALRKAKIVYNFGLSECDRVNIIHFFFNISGREQVHRKYLSDNLQDSRASEGRQQP